MPYSACVVEARCDRTGRALRLCLRSRRQIRARFAKPGSQARASERGWGVWAPRRRPSVALAADRD